MNNTSFSAEAYTRLYKMMTDDLVQSSPGPVPDDSSSSTANIDGPTDQHYDIVKLVKITTLGFIIPIGIVSFFDIFNCFLQVTHEVHHNWPFPDLLGLRRLSTFGGRILTVASQLSQLR